MIERKNSLYPLILILFILPSEKDEWVNISEQELITKKCAYWFIPGHSEVSTTNSRKKRIWISKENLFNLETLNQLIENIMQ